MVTHPAPPQTRTCAINAYGSSSRAAAAPGAVHWPAVVRVGELYVSPLSPASGCSARRRLPSRGSLGPHFPTFISTMRRYDCHPVPLGGFACRSPSRYLACFHSSWSPSRARDHGESSQDPARAFGHPVPHSGYLVKETGGSPKFPSSPCGDMPRSQTPVVSCALAIARPGLLPSSACKPSATHDYTHFGAQSRGLSSRYTRLHTAPYGEARGFATDRLARRESGRT